MSGFFSPRKGVALLTALGLLAVLSISSLQHASGTPQTKIEYWVVEVDVNASDRPSRAVQERLSKLGESGWNLIDIQEEPENANVLWLVLSREER
jgi:hypothetical protein